MSDQIQLAIGAVPWCPSPDSKLVEEYAHYDMPLSGLIEQAGCTYLFECVEGVGMNFNIWAYAPVTPREAEQLNRLDGEELTEAIGGLLEAGPITVALAAEDQVATGAVIETADLRTNGVFDAAISRIGQILRRELSITETLQGVAS